MATSPPPPAAEPPARLATLEAVNAAIWRELRDAVEGRVRGHGWRTPVLATVDGSLPDARTVVLREVDVAARRLTVYSDARAAKVEQARRMPGAMLVLWCPRLGWQLRCRVVLDLQVGGLAAASRWARVRLTPAAQDYLSPLPPGAVLGDEPAAAGEPGVPMPPTRSETIDRGSFAVLEAQVVSTDWLELHPEGHRRARFDPQGARWLQP
jgi:hypothetical protein